MKNKYPILVLSILVLISCKNNTEVKTSESTTVEKTQESEPQKKEQHWSYEGETGPEHWEEIEKQSDCNGKRQSPINIIESDAVIDTTLTPLNIFYSNDVKIHDVTNNGHSIQYNFEKGDYITLGDDKYELKQIHFHEASEHTINGVRYPIEMHLVHLNKNNKIAVLSVMAIEGTSSETYTFLDKYLPIKVGETKQVNSTFDLNLKLPENREYYTYQGSLTTPPCTESVSWFVFKTPIMVSLKQVKLLQELMPLNNYRNEQDLQGRIVNHYIPQ